MPPLHRSSEPSALTLLLLGDNKGDENFSQLVLASFLPLAPLPCLCQELRARKTLQEKQQKNIETYMVVYL